MPEEQEKAKGRVPVLEALEMSSLLNALRPDQKASLAASAIPAQASKGEVIWLGGTNQDYFGLVRSGFVKMVRADTGGTETVLELMGPGQIFGMLGLIEGSGCPLSAVAVTDVSYLKIPKRALLPIYEQSMALKEQLIRRITTRLHNTHEILAHMTRGRVEERIASILLLLAQSYGERINDTIELQVPLTRQDISDMAGTTVETTIRILSRWQKEKILSTSKHYITILDEHALESFLTV